MMEVDNDEEYDNQFTGYEDTKDSSQALSKRMKQSPRVKKWDRLTIELLSYFNQAIELILKTWKNAFLGIPL